MTNLNLNLPTTLYEQLREEAAYEGMPLDQYVIYALARQSSIPYLYKIPARDVAKQREEFEAFRARLPKASPEEVERLLAERDVVPPEEQLPEEILQRFETMLAEIRENPYSVDGE
jgi:hypothetical protein